MLQISPKASEKIQKFLKIKQVPGDIEKKLWEKVYRYTPALRFIPGVLMVGVGNSLSMNACHEDSDIDLFIVSKKNRIWTVRILVTLYFSILGLRKTGKKHAGKFCLSFFATEDALDFKEIAIEDDIYLFFWMIYMKPIINKEDTFKKFLDINSRWCDFSPHQSMLKNNTQYIRFQSPARSSKNAKGSQKGGSFLQSIGNTGENIGKSIFLPKTRKSFERLGKPFGVIISDDMLKFHDKDRRKEIRGTIV